MSLKAFWSQTQLQRKAFQELSKSGIVTLVLISVLAGYAIGHHPEAPVDWMRLIGTLVGILFLSSGSSALNQFQEIEIDKQMPRTAGRPLPSGRLSRSSVVAFIVLTVFLGLGILWLLSGVLFGLGVLAVVSYNGLYTLWWKRKWSYAAVPGAVPGALPILMGFVSADGSIFSPAGWYLFFILFFWQMPHFWVLALRYKEDYQKGGFPTLPVTHGKNLTVHQITLWCLAYVGLAMLAPFFFPVTWVFFVLSCLMTLMVLRALFAFAKEPESQKWLHFFLWINLSLVVYLGAIALDLWTQEIIVLARNQLSE